MRLVASSGREDAYSWKVKAQVKIMGRLARLARVLDPEDQGEASRRVFASDTCWTIVESNRTSRADFALFMVDALTNDQLIHETPAIVGRQTPSALAHIAVEAHANPATGAGAR